MAKRKRKSEPPPSDPPTPPAPLSVVWTTHFRRDVEKAKRSSRDMAKLTAIMTSIAERRSLDAGREDHPLRGPWKGYRDCHVEGDWVLIYKIEDEQAIFVRTGAHSEVFGR